MAHNVSIRPCPYAIASQVRTAIDAIFFEASSRQSFNSVTERDAFHWLWLGRYLQEEPQHAFLAHADDDNVCGYLVGSLADPAQRQAFATLDYFKSFAPFTHRYPAHLHINIAASWRGQGLGARLIEAFVTHIQRHNVHGVHVVTGAGMRNVRFYQRLGFHEVARTGAAPRSVVMLARSV